MPLEIEKLSTRLVLRGIPSILLVLLHSQNEFVTVFAVNTSRRTKYYCHRDVAATQKHLVSYRRNQECAGTTEPKSGSNHSTRQVAEDETSSDRLAFQPRAFDQSSYVASGFCRLNASYHDPRVFSTSPDTSTTSFRTFSHPTNQAHLAGPEDGFLHRSHDVFYPSAPWHTTTFQRGNVRDYVNSIVTLA